MKALKLMGCGGLLAVLVLAGGRAQAVRPALPRPTPGDDPPGVDCLGNTTASFEASADTVEWGQSVTVSWSIQVPSGCAAVTQSISGRGAVARSGSFTIGPTSDVNYVLKASMAGAYRTLGSVSVAIQRTQPKLAYGPENLDANPQRDVTRELTMTAGRLNKVPVSGAWYGQFTLTTATTTPDTRVEVRARCVSLTAASDLCDPGLLLVATNAGGQVLNLAFNNDHLAGGANGLGSYVSLSQGPGQTVTYQAVVYSHHRGTSRVNVQWAATPATAPTDWTVPNAFQDPLNPSLTVVNLDQVVGGVLVALGPVDGTDHLNVRTVDDGAMAGTRMWLFNLTRRAFAFVDGPASGDRDPDYAFNAAWECDAACASQHLISETFAIIGKDDPASGRLEVWVDLVKSISAGETLVNFPRICNGSFERTDCFNPADTILDPGVYFFSVFATTSFAVGAVPAIDGKAHPGSETGNPLCYNVHLPPGGGITVTSMNRGQGNDLALTLELLEDGQVVRTRHVPRGALGGYKRDSLEWNRLTLEHTVPDDGLTHRYGINLRQVGPRVWVDSRWSFRRNPESVELKVASLNVEYGGDMQAPGEMQNVADLMGGGADYLGSEVAYRTNRGQWRWEADILNFNEIMPDRGSWMQDRLNGRTALPWLRSEGESVWPHNNPFAPVRFGPLLLNQFAQSGGGSPSFGGVLDQIGDCNSANNHCRLVIAYDLPPADRIYSTVPARAAVRRLKGSNGGFLERPIAVFHTYLPYDDDEIDERDEGTTNLVRRMQSLLALQPLAFNSSGNRDPRDPGNRMIVLGDSNMSNNQCSEVNATLRKLREVFGYAIDVSMAATDGDQRTYDMHYSGAPITDLRTGTYGDCRDTAWAGNWGQGGPHGCSFHYRPQSSWIDDERPRNTDLEQFYSWWAGTSSELGGGGSRLDVILLVGLGWADDDPVREYLAMANTEVPNSANGFQPAGVEIRPSCGEDAQYLTFKAANYQPENQVCSEVPAQPGALAFRSDHKPVGARLRVQFYR